MQYDIAVAYRIYPIVAKPAKSLPYGDDKLALSEICLKSFKESLGALRVKVWAILDGCPSSYELMFRKYFEKNDLEIISVAGIGNHATFRTQINLLLAQQDAELVYFAEDDYFYLPDAFSDMVQFLKSSEQVDFVSPYDHLDCYRLSLHHHSIWLRLYGGRHWRTAASTCLTFLTRKETLRDLQGIFLSYCSGNSDASVWLSLTKYSLFNPVSFLRYVGAEKLFAKIIAKAWIHCWKQILLGHRRKLWVPIPAVASHLSGLALSPGIDWKTLIRKQGDQIERSRNTLPCNM